MSLGDLIKSARLAHQRLRSRSPAGQALFPQLVQEHHRGGQFVLHAEALHGNPFDGHTLGPVVADLERLTGCGPALRSRFLGSSQRPRDGSTRSRW